MSVSDILYEDLIPPAAHWSLTMKPGYRLKLIDEEGGANLGMLFYNPSNLLERYNAPDTLKCQHTFKLTKGHCLYSDMGRIFCSITEDSLGWHDTVCGNTSKASVAKKWGEKHYQEYRNQRQQNGYDSFLVELAKYGLGKKDLAANVNWFSRVRADEAGNMLFVADHSSAGASVELRFEMETLVLFHTCPHPLNSAEDYPRKPVRYQILSAAPAQEDDSCRNSCDENQRGFKNNELFHLQGATS